VQRSISYQIPGIKYNGYLIYYCEFPNHISLSNPFSAAFWEHFKADLEGYKTSKAVIQIPTDKPLPEKLVKEIVAFRKKENEIKNQEPRVKINCTAKEKPNAKKAAGKKK
jgi:uncharacterized protein YdhG (YjbR/CyaY superfamily)